MLNQRWPRPQPVAAAAEEASGPSTTAPAARGRGEMSFGDRCEPQSWSYPLKAVCGPWGNSQAHLRDNMGSVHITAVSEYHSKANPNPFAGGGSSLQFVKIATSVRSGRVEGNKTRSACPSALWASVSLSANKDHHHAVKHLPAPNGYTGGCGAQE